MIEVLEKITRIRPKMTEMADAVRGQPQPEFADFGCAAADIMPSGAALPSKESEPRAMRLINSQAHNRSIGIAAVILASSIVLSACSDSAPDDPVAPNDGWSAV